MNIKEYIESGIIERYVLGLATWDEQQEFELLSRQFPKLIHEKLSIELALETQLLKEAVIPPEDVKQKILSSFDTTEANDLYKQLSTYNFPAHKINVWKLISAACIVLLAGSVYLSCLLTEKYKKLQVSDIELKSKLDYSHYVNPITALRPVIQRPSIQWSAMVEPANSSHCMAHVYWDSLSKNTFLLIGNIEQPFSDKQFQLWALPDKHPVNLGVFDVKNEGQLLQMKNVYKAKVFVITIEPKGGSSTPTMKAMYAAGKL